MEQSLEDKLGALLSNPDLMSKISAMAQSLGSAQSSQAQPTQPQQSNAPDVASSGFDPNILRKLSSMTGAFGVDREQRALLSALSPYLSRDRIHKLENAMRAAKMAALAASAIQQNPTPPSSGR